MTSEESIAVSGKIAQVIASQAPYMEYNLKEVEEAKRRYSPSELSALKRKGYLDGDFEKFYVLNEFQKALLLEQKADEEYMRRFFRQGKKFLPSEFLSDPYIKRVKVKETRMGDFLLTNATYAKGEFFQYAMPDLSAPLVVPKIGFFTGEVSFPTVYEGNIPWMSACPSEISSMKHQMEEAFGRVLVLGLGIGYYPFIVSQKSNVSEITVVEIQPEVIALFEQNILPFFPRRDKIKIIKADAFSYLKTVKDGQFDYCFADIWEGQEDGAECYKRIKPVDDSLPRTKFSYWIEEEILWYLRQK